MTDQVPATTRREGESAVEFIERRMAQRLLEAKRRSTTTPSFRVYTNEPPQRSVDEMDVECRRKLDLDATLHVVATRHAPRGDSESMRSLPPSSERPETLREVLGARPLLFVADTVGVVSPPVAHSEIWSQHHSDASRHESVEAGSPAAGLLRTEASPIRTAPSPPQHSPPQSLPCQQRVATVRASNHREEMSACSNGSSSDISMLTDHRRVSAIVPPTVGAPPRRPPKADSFWITVWPGYYRHGRPCRICVSPRFMYFQTVVERAAAATMCTPAPSILYSPNGGVAADLEDLAIDGHYIIAPSAVLYRPEMVPDALLHILVKRAKHALVGPR